MFTWAYKAMFFRCFEKKVSKFMQKLVFFIQFVQDAFFSPYASRMLLKYLDLQQAVSAVFISQL